MSAAGRRAVIFDPYAHVYGGAQHINHLLAAELPPRGWPVVTIVPVDGLFADRLRADGLPVEVVTVPASLGRYGRTTTGARLGRAALDLPRYWMQLARALRRLRPTVVHATDHRGVLLAAVPARLAGARIVWHVHAFHANRTLNAVTRRLAHQVVVPSASLLTQMPGIEGGRRAAAVFPNPLEQRPDGPIGPPPAEPRVLSIGRLHPDKGHDVLIEAFASVVRSHPTAQLCIIGGEQEGYERYVAMLHDRIAALDLGASVELLGASDDIVAALRTARVYVQASRTETFGLAILEAMASGVPVVATDVGGVPDLVRHEETGLLVPTERPDALAEAILRLLDDQAACGDLSDAARALALSERFSIEAFVGAVTDLYAELAPSATGRP